MSSEILKAISENERIYRHVQQIAGLGTYVMDIPTGRFSSSTILDDIFGITESYPRTFEGWETILHPDDRQMMIEYFKQYVLGLHRRFDKEYRIIRPSDGVERWIHGYGELDLDENNQPVFMTGTIQDVTERKRAEKALQQSETRYRELIDLAVDGILVGSPTGIIIDANRFMCQLCGLSHSELVGKYIANVLFTPETLASDPFRFDLLQKGETVISERQIRHRDGTIVLVEMRTKMMPDGTYQSIYRDITERKTTEKSLLNFTKILAQRVEERTHELETANATLKGTVDQLRKLAIELTQAEEVERKRVAAILHDHVQQYIAAATMKISLLDGPVSMADRTRGVKESLALLGEALDASRSLTVSLCPPVLLEAGLMPGLRWLAEWMADKHGLTVKVQGDESHNVPGSLGIFLFQAVRELLFNIVKHAGVNQASVYVDQLDPKTLRLVIVDHGKGFSPKDSHVPALSGGFGLFQLRERLTYIGGALDVASDATQGTRVTITVPV